MWNSWDSNSRVSLFQIKMGVFVHYKSPKEAEHEVWQNLAAFLTYHKRKKNKHPAPEVFFGQIIAKISHLKRSSHLNKGNKS